MTSDDYTIRRITRPDGTETIEFLSHGSSDQLGPFDCGVWAEHTLGVQQAEVVIRKAAAKGFPLTTDDVISLGPPEYGEPEGFALSELAFSRAVHWVTANSPDGYHLGLKAIDIWFMPDTWWAEVGGDDLAHGDSGLDGDWGLADLGDEG